MSRAGEPDTDRRGIPEERYLEIDLGRSRRLWGVISYLLFYLLVAFALAAVLMQFTRSSKLAIGLVVMMVGYMGLMGRCAVQSIERQHGRR